MNWTIWRGYSFLIATLLAAISLLVPAAMPLASTLIWLTALSGITLLAGRARNQTLVLFGIGLGGLIYANLAGQSIPWQALLASNSVLLAMLFAVSFLALVATPTSKSKNRPLPTGNKGLASTLLANHLFGSVINISSVIVVGERLKNLRPIDLPLASALSLSFGLCSLWSPFFASMAYAMTLVPDMSLYSVMLMGLPLSAVGIAIIYWHQRQFNHSLPGYPLKGRSLMLPTLLAALVIIGHELWPNLPIPKIIIISALLLVLVALLKEQRLQLIHKHCQTRLGNYINESAIFLAAGVFAVGLNQLLLVTPIGLPFTQYGPLEACIVLALGLTAGRLGIHAIMIMAVFNPLLQTLNPAPDLLAFTYLAIWAIGMGFNPVSGTLLTIQGNFGIKGSQLVHYNTPQVTLLFVLTCFSFWIYSVIS